MSGTSWLDWRLPEAGLRRERSLEDRAALAFTIVALLDVLGVIVAPWGGPPSLLLDATSVLATIGITALYFVEARAIERRRRWAILAIRPLLVLMTVFGIYSVLVALQEGWHKVPIDAALGVWAWLARSEGHPPGRSIDRPGTPQTRGTALRGTALRASSLVVSVTLLESAIWYGGPIFGWGGLLDVHQPDLAVSLHVDCGPPGGPPAALNVTFDWSWRIRPLLPSGLDMVVIGWSGVDGQGRVLYLLGDEPDIGPGIQSGLQAFPSVDMASQVETETPGSWHWGIHLDRQGLAPGQIPFNLQLAHASPPEPGPVTVTATYIHLGLWRQAAPSVTCSW